MKSSLDNRRAELSALPNKTDLLIFSLGAVQEPLLHSPTIVTLPRLPGPLEIARLVYEHTARGHRGLVEVETAKGLLRLQLSVGFVLALDVGPQAPVGADSQVRYLLRARDQASFRLGQTLPGRFLIEPFRPDASIRAHVEAQTLSVERLRERIGEQAVTVSFPPHPSALFGEERAMLLRLATAQSVDQLVQSVESTHSRVLRLLLFLDALGVLVVGLPSYRDSQRRKERVSAPRTQPSSRSVSARLSLRAASAGRSLCGAACGVSAAGRSCHECGAQRSR